MISVAMTTYNGEKYIRKQIESILNQSMKVDEIIVCDDGSTDKTVEILKEYPVTVYQNEKNLGYRLNFKKAMSLCTHEYTFLCDQDDIWKPDKVKIMIEIMQKNPNIHVLASSFVYIDSKDNLILMKQKKNFSNNNLYPRFVKSEALVSIGFDEYLPMNYFQGCSLVLDKWIKDLVLKNFDDRLPHDWLISMIASSYQGMFFFNKALFKYRLHDNNSIGVEYLTQSTSEHIQKASSTELRMQNSLNALIVLEDVEKMNPAFYETREKEFKELKKFLVKHNQNLENKSFFGLLKQNTQPFYKLIKTKKARVMDLVFALKK
ncbi:Glycosyltransferases involved in cell wall biogenesis [Faecalitalea cylindroides T2-87]|uniref:Glycosyltransferases involved in cell wall biogenesis n=1 Tax=Faecalitalea cylindroides T2-87 TaxID=717960 RepID=D4JF25_9FIRM|nr:Glycosyltransferases involved in cell wall biogenesis [Faecalitalea cylindroides T2-87]